MRPAFSADSEKGPFTTDMSHTVAVRRHRTRKIYPVLVHRCARKRVARPGVDAHRGCHCHHEQESDVGVVVLPHQKPGVVQLLGHRLHLSDCCTVLLLVLANNERKKAQGKMTPSIAYGRCMPTQSPRCCCAHKRRGTVGAGLCLRSNNLAEGQQALFLLPPFPMSYHGRTWNSQESLNRPTWVVVGMREWRGGLAIRYWCPRVLVHGSRT